MNGSTSSTSQIDRRKARWLAIMFVLAFGVAGGQSASAQNHPCGSDIDTQRIAYVAEFTNILDSRTDPTDTDHKVLLVGAPHYKTPAAGTILKNRPVLIFNHGHEQKPE